MRRAVRRSCSSGVGRRGLSVLPVATDRSVLEESGAHLRMPRLRSPDVDNGRDGDAPVEVAAHGLVLGRASHGDALEWYVGSPARGPARRHVQDGLVAGAEAQTIDD